MSRMKSGLFAALLATAAIAAASSISNPGGAGGSSGTGNCAGNTDCVATVTAANSTITIGGTAQAPTVKVTSGTYAPATSGSAILKGNGSGGFSSAASGTDYAPATSGSSILKGNGSGAFSSATSGTDYAPATSGSAILKGNGSGGFSSATSGTDYAPATSGSSILKGNGSGAFSSATSGTDFAPATSGSAILKGNGSGGFSSATSGTDYVAPGVDVNTSGQVTASHLASALPGTQGGTGVACTPTAGQILVGNAGGTAYGCVTVAGDATIGSTGAVSVTKAGGVTIKTMAAQNATAVAITGGTITGVSDAEVAVGNCGSSKTIDWSQGWKQTVTLNSATCTLTYTNLPQGFSARLVIKQDSTGGRLITWPSSGGNGCVTKWQNGNAVVLSTGASAIDKVLIDYDGTNCYSDGGINYSANDQFFALLERIA